MTDHLRPLVDRVAALAAAVRSSPHFEWGTVTSVTPLQVRLDGDPEPLLGTPASLVPVLVVGDRVQVVIQNRRATVTGTPSSVLADELAWSRARARHISSDPGTGRTYVGGRAGQDGALVAGGAHLGLDPDAAGASLVAWIMQGGIQRAGFTADGGLDMLKMAYAMAGGFAAPVAVAAAGTVNTTITLPAGRFTVPPLVIPGLADGIRDVNVSAHSVTLTSFVLSRGSNSTASRTFGARWVAVQMTPTSESG